MFAVLVASRKTVTKVVSSSQVEMDIEMQVWNHRPLRGRNGRSARKKSESKKRRRCMNFRDSYKRSGFPAAAQTAKQKQWELERSHGDFGTTATISRCSSLMHVWNGSQPSVYGGKCSPYPMFGMTWSLGEELRTLRVPVRWNNSPTSLPNSHLGVQFQWQVNML